MMTSMKDSDGNLFISRISEAFEKEGYSVYIKTVNAKDYGVPQSRERIILVGILEKTGTKYVFPKVWKKNRSFRYATNDLQRLESGERSQTDPLHWAITHPQHVIEWLKKVDE